MERNEQENEDGRVWRLLWLSSLQAFADRETQKDLWLDRTQRNPHYSFTECMCSYFDDAGLGEEDAYQKRLADGDVTEDEVFAMTEFHSLASEYVSPGGDDYDTEAILRDPDWRRVVDAACSAQRSLLRFLSDATERAALTEPLKWQERDGAFYADLINTRIMPARRYVAEHYRNRFKRLVRRFFGLPTS